MKTSNFITQALIILYAFAANGQDNYTDVTKSFPLLTSELHIKNDYADQIRLHTWGEDSIRVDAKVLLIDEDNKRKDDDFDISFRKSGSVSSLTLEIKNIKANYVFQKSGSDFDPKKSKLYRADKALLIGTEIDIYIPQAINVELESEMGEMQIDHNGGNLLITTNNNISLEVKETLNANISFSSLYGELKISKNLNIKENNTSEGQYKVLSSNKQASYLLNNGGVEISLITLGDITITSKK